MISHIEEISSFAGCPKGKVAMESKRLKYQRENCHFIDSGMIAIVVILKGYCDIMKNLAPLTISVVADNLPCCKSHERCIMKKSILACVRFMSNKEYLIICEHA